ncbi:MAG TPA: PIN domain nuclease [Vicinamibacterales bacterium]|nr:PIN domain nuclease [Vicinamibacterales bacterium]
MVIVDSSVWIDYLNDVDTPEADWLDLQLAQQRLGLLDLMLCEVLQGIGSEAQARVVLEHMKRFAILDSGGADLAVAAAANHRALRAKGHTVRKTIDCLIATFCIREGHQLLHSDHDFDPFEERLGLRVIHPGVHRTR